MKLFRRRWFRWCLGANLIGLGVGLLIWAAYRFAWSGTGFQGKTVWDGMVEVFSLKGHPTVFRAYAWAHDTDDPANPRRHVIVLHAHPVKSAEDAVRAAIVQEFRNLGTAEES